MEDKRTLLAFLLIGLLLLALPYYYELVGLAPQQAPQEPTTPAPAEPAEQEKSSPPLPPPATSFSAEETSPVETTSVPPLFVVPEKKSFIPRHIVVRTPLQQLTFSTEGGVLTSARLLQYNQQGDEKVELIPEGGRGLVVSLKYRDTVEDLSRVEFTPVPERSEILIGPQEEASLRFRADLGGGGYLEKAFTFSGDHYGIEMELRYYGVISDSEVFLGWEKGIANTEAKGSDGSSYLVGAGGQDIGAVAFMNEERITVDDEGSLVADKGLVKWAGVINQYFFLALAPLDEGHYRVELYGQVPDQPFEWETYSFRVGSRLSGSGTWRNLVYLGPLKFHELSTYQVDLEKGIDLGWPVIRHISKVLLVLFIAAHTYVPNYGWVLILFAAAIKILVYPLTHKSYASMAKMQEAQPKITALREKYKNDQQRLSRETMKLYKEEGVNPLGGCLPMLLQMPVFFALYKVFYTVELRQAPFIFWITDLSRPDELMMAGFELHVLPFLMAGSMAIQQKMTMKDPKQALMVYLMPVILLFIFWSLPSGLVLYWTTFNILTVVQQVLVNHLKQTQGKPLPAK